jgi:DNA polymerase-3 subunit delta
MIIKTYDLEKKDLKNKQYFLLYGENQGHKIEIIEKKFKNNYSDNIYNFEENDILSNKENFFNDIFSKSFFENKKLIIINRATDKLINVVEEIIKKKITDLTIVFNANILEKKSKIRALFEKNKETICVPFYADSSQTLMSIINIFFREKKIPISQQAINLIVERCRGDRQNLKNELQKIDGFMQNKNKIEITDILKLTNLAENYNVSELIDSCLAKNKKKTIHILNENNYSLEDCILIIRTFLIKTKRLLKLSKQIIEKNNIDDVIASFKPPIFWKDKEIIKQQVKNWSYTDIEDLIYKINETELLIKKNSNNSINILYNFIMEKTKIPNN